MTRKRMISPQIWEDPSFNKLSISARLLFIGMFSNADDEGYLRADPGGLKRLIFGFDEIKQEDIILWRGELSTMVKNLHIFENNGEEYAHFLNWAKYQKQQKDRIQESLYPKCSKCVAGDKQPLTEVKSSQVKIDKSNIYTPEFLSFWNDYPNKTGKGKAFESWQKRKKPIPALQAVLKAVEKCKQTEQWQKDSGQFIPHPATWLNQRRWEDFDLEEKPKEKLEAVEKGGKVVMRKVVL